MARDRKIQGDRKTKVLCRRPRKGSAVKEPQRGMGSLKRLEKENEVDDKKTKTRFRSFETLGSGDLSSKLSATSNFAVVGGTLCG